MIEQELGRPPESSSRSGTRCRSPPRRSARCTARSPTKGVAVAVKVQYPGVGEAIEADLGNVGLLFGGLGQVFPGLDSGPLVAELRAPPARGARLRARGRAPAAVRRLLRRPPVHPHPRRCSPSYSTERVLTTELAEGVRFAEARDVAAGRSATSPAETIFRFVFGSLYRLQPVQRRPAPGQLPVPARRPGHVPRLRAGHAVRRRRARGAPGADRDASCSTRTRPRSARAVEDAGFLAAGRAGHRRRGRRLLRPLLRVPAGGRGALDARPRVRQRERPPGLRRDRPVPRGDAPRQRPAGVRHRAADQPRPVRGARRARRHRELAPAGRGDVAVGRGPAVDAAGRARARLAGAGH